MTTMLESAVPHPRPAPIVPDVPVWRFTVGEYHELLRVGVLEDGDPVELLEGMVVAKMTKGCRHVIASTRTRQAIERVLPAGWHLEVQDPVTTSDSEPEPDLVVVRGQPDDYPDHPGAADTPLIIEVADSTIGRDRGIKQRIYARAGIVEYWIINLVDDVLEVYSQPSGPVDGPQFAAQSKLSLKQSVPLRLDGDIVGEIPVADLIPR